MRIYIGRFRKILGLLIVLLSLSSLLEILFAYIIQNAIDITVKGEFESFKVIILYFLLFIAANFAVGYAVNLTEAKFSQRLMLKLREDLFSSVITRNYREYKKSSVGEKLNLFENDLEVIETDYFKNIIVIVQSLLLIVFTVSYLLGINVVFTLCLLGCSVLMLSLPVWLSRKLNLLNDGLSGSRAVYLTRLKDFFTGIEVIKSNSIESRIIGEHEQVAGGLEHSRFQFSRFLGLFQQLTINSHYFIIIICFSAGGLLMINGQMSIGQLIAAVQLLNKVIMPMNALSEAIMGIKGSQLIVQRVEQLLASREEAGERSAAPIAPIAFHSLQVQQLCFSYEAGTGPVLKNINLEIQPRKKYAIVGTSGSGKSTLLQAITGFIRDYQGQILINQEDVEALNEEELVHFFSYIHQSTFIFKDTLENNLTLYQDYPGDRIEQAIIDARLEALIERLPSKLQYMCDEEGSNLSGGEKQRISIARALLRDTAVLILDEGTASLDNETAARIEHTLLGIEDKTVIVVTHKLEQTFLRGFDQILCMNQGEIVEQGSFDELMNHRRFFYNLYNVYEPDSAGSVAVTAAV